MKKNSVQFTNVLKVASQPDTGISKYGIIAILAQVIILFILLSPLILASEILDYSDLKAAIKAAYQARSDLLQNSTGTANIIIETKKLTGEANNTPAKKGKWTVTWYKKAVKNRYNIYVPPPQKEDDNHKPLLEPQNIRTVQDAEKRIYYDVLNRAAYIDRRLPLAGNPFGLVRHFDISRLYRFSRRYDLSDLLTAWEKEGVQRQIKEDRVGQTHCIKLEFNWEKLYPSGYKRKKRLKLWVAPEMSYSLIKAQFFSTSGGELFLVESYEATYRKSKVEGIWLLKEVTIVDNQCGLRQDRRERLTAKFCNTKVGVEITDETFTFEGLGVPKGTKVYDKRFGETVESYYHGLSKSEQTGTIVKEGTEDGNNN